MTGCSSAPSFTSLLSPSSASRTRSTASETQNGGFRSLCCPGGDLASSCRNLSPLVCVRTNLVCSLSSSLTKSPQIELEPLIEGRTHLTDEDNLRMVGIKIQLRKECKFGEQFFIVGAQPDLGLWNPLDAVPMTWSDGHLWTAELDIPVGEPLHYKFLLREISGKFLWQPGKDRVLHTWETCNIISVIEDWENVEAQQVHEERVVSKCEESDLKETKIKQLKHSDEKYNDEETCESSEFANKAVCSNHEIVATAANNFSDYSNTDMEINDEICGNQVVDENIILQPAENEDAISESGSVEEDQIKEEEQVKIELNNSKNVNDREAETAIEEKVKGYRELEKVNGRSLTFNAEHPDLKVDNDEDAYCNGDQDLESALSERPIFRESDPLRDEIKWGQRTLQRFLNNFGFL